MDLNPDDIFARRLGPGSRGASSNRRKPQSSQSIKRRKPEGENGSLNGPTVRKNQLKLPLLRNIMVPEQKMERTVKPTAYHSKGTNYKHFEEQLLLMTGEDAITFFARHGNNTPVKFVYCNRAELGDEFRPYDLVVVDRKKVNSEHFTISAAGVVHVQPHEPSEFISLSDWMHQSTLFNVLRSIRFFKHYLIAKMFRLWRSNVRYRLYCKQRKLLGRNLFLARPSFCGSLVEANKLMFEMDSIRLSKIKSTVCEADAFEGDQVAQRNSAVKKFEEKLDKLEVCVEKVCKGVKERARAYDHGVASDDMANSRFAQHLLGGNGRTKSMVSVKKERAERVRRLKHAALEADMLGDFIRLVDYIEVEHLYQIVVNTTVDFLGQLQSRRTALFQSTVSFDDTSLVFTPGVRDFHSLLTTMTESIVSTVDSFDRIVTNAKFTPYVSSMVQGGPKVQKIIHHDKTFNDTRGEITQKIDEDFLLATRTVSFLEKHRPVYEFGKQWDAEVYHQQDHTVQSIQADMAQQTDWTVEIDRIRQLYDAGIFQAETRQLKFALVPITTQALNDMKDLLLKIFSQKCSELHSLYLEKIKQLDDDPHTLPTYAKHVENFAKIKEEGTDMADRAAKIETMHQMLMDHNVKIPSQDAVAFDDLQSSVKAFAEQQETTGGRIENKMLSMRQTVYKNIHRLNNELQAQKAVLDQGVFVSESAKPHQAVKALEALKVTLDEIEQQTVTLRGYQVLFDIEPYQFNSLTETMDAFNRKHDFWTMYQTWLDKTKLWKDGDFLTLDVEQMNEEVKEFFLKAHKLNKELKDSAVTQKVKHMINEWKLVMPMIVDLGNKAIKQSHWRQLFTSLGHTFYPTDKIRLKKLRSLNIFNHKQLISDITESAVGEYALEQSLKKIQDNWANQEFITAPYGKKGDTWILGEVDEVIAALEDNQVGLQTMLASRYITAVQQEVESWDKKLSFLSEVIDEWLQCQRQWMYLEPIFSAADIVRQLPMEAKLFADVDRFWKDHMRKTHQNPNVLHSIRANGILSQFQKANEELDRIQKNLEEYLETKRSAFPRFYFLSNDELLQILSQSREPQAVQPHLRKCFDSIASLIFTDEPNSTEVTGMVSGEGEKVNFVRSVMTVGNTESWLSDVELIMRESIKEQTRKALLAYPDDGLNRGGWLQSYASQAILAVDMIMWTKLAAVALLAIENGTNANAMREFLEFSKSQIGASVELVRSDLDKQMRMTMSSLIVLDVHARDVVERMVEQKCSAMTDYEWTKQLRYYWKVDEEEKKAAESRGGDEDESTANFAPSFEDCWCLQTNSSFRYRYEYLGNSPRLVITPLTDKAYLTLTGALHLHYGGAPAGPAGTGKTETVKDLAKALGTQNVVFNCSDGLNSKMMARFFSGLAQCGAWACFDEFNRIDIEVLSVIAQQILTIQQAIVSKKSPFEFEGRLIPLDANFGVFITMNPGYAGRTELPDNLKSLFRPVAMMVPDYGLIAQIILFSEGFQTATSLSKKMVQLYKLSSEQLSKQDHYDFGMRAVKSVLVMAGALKRKESELAEDVVLIRAMRDSNVPKFLSHDLPLFRGIISDLFPGVDVPFVDYGQLQQQIEKELVDAKLQVVPDFVTKVIQLHETTIVRHGVMLVGSTMTGKTTCTTVLSRALSNLKKQGVEGVNFEEVQEFRLNPKSITMGELYGQVNPVSYEWTEGLVALLVREAAADQGSARKWVEFDGPVDALWIENMNTVLDDNKVLCLANGERIKLAPTITMLFEVNDLAVASPATVSRCGMVFLEPVHLGWEPLIDTWKVTKLTDIAPQRADYVVEKLKKHISPLLQYVQNKCSQKVPAVENNLVESCLNLLWSLLLRVKEVKDSTTPEGEPGLTDVQFNDLVSMNLFLALVWSFGANITDDGRDAFSAFIRGECGTLVPSLPEEGSVYDYCTDMDSMSFASWQTKVPDFEYDPSVPYFNILVPTADTVKYGFFLETLTNNGINVLLMGDTGVGKTVVIQDYLMRSSAGEEKATALPITCMLSAQTTSRNLQDIFETKLEKKRKNLLGAPVGKKVLFFVDDLNMPKKEEYGAQPPIELLRQVLDSKGFYDRKKLFFKHVQDVVFMAACAAPGGGRNTVTARLTRHFHHIWQPDLSEASMKRIFSGILSGFLGTTGDHLEADPVALGNQIVDVAVIMYNSIRENMLPTPSKSHYTFNLRDMGKVIQGILQVNKANIGDIPQLVRLWLHETSRVFRDRLLENDRLWFDKMCVDKVKQEMGLDVVVGDSLLWGDYMSPNDDKPYSEIKATENADQQKLSDKLDEFLSEYNMVYSNQMHLVFFRDAIAHLSRICRILRQPRGNALLVGVGGSGRQSLCRLGAFIAGYKCQSIEITRNFSVEDWHTFLKGLLEVAGCDNQPVVFLFTDSQVVHESFLEDINNILNSGEVPNLHEPEELDAIVAKVRPLCKAAGKVETRDNIMAHFVQLVRENLHVVLAFSPVGEAFRSRCRQYPSLVNCCTIDWYSAWPEDALFSVAQRFLSSAELGVDQYREQLCHLCVKIHMSVADITTSFFQKLRRHNYVTPTSYLELIKLYTGMLGDQRNIVTTNLSRYEGGLQKLQETNKMVDEMKTDLVKLQPVLKQSSEETAALLVTLEKDQKEAAETAQVVKKDAEACQETTRQVMIIKDDCQRGLDEALPAYESAIAALNTLNKDHIGILKTFTSPPKGVVKVMEAVCLLFGEKTSWADAKKLISTSTFLERCKTYDKDKIPRTTIKKLQKYITDSDFVPEKLEAVSTAAVSLCMWVRAMDTYSRVAKQIAPKRKALAQAEEQLAEAQATLASKQASLRSVEARVASLQAKFKAKMTEKQDLEDKMQQTKARLARAGVLVEGLGSEEVRWNKTAGGLKNDVKNLVGNMMLSAGCISYMGPFTADFRSDLVAMWNKAALELNIPTDEAFSFTRVLSDPLTVRQWNLKGLPADNHSTENGLLVTLGRRWPLMIDPQAQANRWLKALGKKDNIQTIKLTEPNYLRTLENAIRYGQPVLLENVEEKLDAAIEPVLLKQIFKKGGQWLLKLGDQDVPYSTDFRFYITTKMPNPHYLPETFVKVTIINFTVTPKGLEDQLLEVVCGLERPDLEAKNDQLIVQIADDKKELSDIEKKILRLMAESEVNILDDEELIQTLAASKQTSSAINTRMAEAELTVQSIDKIREEYRVVARRGSILYFVIADLAKVDPMYQYSLQYFTNLYRTRIQESEKSDDLQQRLNILLDDLNVSFYVNICQGLFEIHKLLFSFMVTAQIQRANEDISDKQWSFFIRGPSEQVEDPPASPCDWLPAETWVNLLRTTKSLGSAGTFFYSIQQELKDKAKSSQWEKWYKSFDTIPAGDKFPGQESVSAFMRLLVIQCFRPARGVAGVKDFVNTQLGSRYVKSPPFDLHQVYEQSAANTPIIFVLSPGADPMAYLLKLAEEKGKAEDKFRYISLGQGQGPIAEELMNTARREGGWVCLQNCHLAISWMPQLERLLEQGQQEEVHEDYRLWLTSMPTPKFPVPILQNSIKVTNEPPKGLSSNLMRTFLDIEEKEYESCTQPAVFKKLMFGLAFFHAVLLERRKFGSIGWNIPYEWMTSDLVVSQRQLKMYLDEHPDKVPWQTLREIVGEVNYAGRVTDDKDQRCVRSLLASYFTPAILLDDYKFTDSDAWYAPKEGTLQETRDYIKQLPEETPEAFGLHPNADITLQLKESRDLMDVLVSIQPRDAGASGGLTNDEIVEQMSADFAYRLPDPLNPADAHPSVFEGAADGNGENTLGVFLGQELVRFNKLISVMDKSLKELQKAIKGLVVMSSELEKTHECFLFQQVNSRNV